MGDEHRGGKVGPRIANLVSQSIVYTHQKLVGMKHKLAVMVFNTVTNEISDEVDMTLGPIIRQLASDYDRDGPAAAYLNFMGYGRGQLKALAGSQATGQSLSWALGTILSNIFAPDVYDAVGAIPNMLPDSQSAAQMAAIGELSDAQARDIINRNGFADVYANGWIELARAYPGASDALEMWRRGIVDYNGFSELCRFSGMPESMVAAYGGLKRTWTSMEDAAVAYLRGAIDRGSLDAIGSFAGYEPQDITTYLESIGEPPATQELLEAFRRGFIDQGTLERGIKQSRTRDEWIGVIEQLRFSPMSISDAVNASVQGHMSQSDAARISEQNGLEPGAYDVLYQTAGEPLSRTELNQLYNLGLIGSDVVKQGLRESRLKDKYVDGAFELRRRLLEPRTISESVKQGVLNHETGIRKLMEHGFNAEDATTLVDSASSQKIQVFKDRIVSAAEALYVDSAITREELTAVVTQMGYTATEAEFATEAAEYHREAKAISAALNAVRGKYVAHHITTGEASALMDNMGIAASQRDYLLGLWNVEVAANTKMLTPAQIVKAAGSGSLTQDQAMERLEFIGYSADDAALLLGGL